MMTISSGGQPARCTHPTNCGLISALHPPYKACAIILLSALWVGCGNPWLTPTPEATPPPLPVWEVSLGGVATNPGAGGRDNSGNFLLATGEKIIMTAGADGWLNLAMPVAAGKDATLVSFTDPVSGVVLAGDKLVIPVRDAAGKAAMNLQAAVPLLKGTGTRAEGVVSKLEMEMMPFAADLTAWDLRVAVVSFQMRAELKSLPEGSGLRLSAAKSPAWRRARVSSWRRRDCRTESRTSLSLPTLPGWG